MSKKRLNLAPPLAKYRNAASKFINRFWTRLPPNLRVAFFFGFLVLSTTLAVVNPYTRNAGWEIYKEGDIVRHTIASPADIIETDEAETKKWREAAAEIVKPIFIFESNRAEQAVLSFRGAWEDLRRQNTIIPNANDNTSKPELNWTGKGGVEVAKVIAARNFSSNDLELLTQVLRESAGGYIYNEADAPVLETEIAVIEPQKPNQLSSLSMPLNSMTALPAARLKLRERMGEISNFTTQEKGVFYQALAPLIVSSVTFDSAKTQLAKNLAAGSIPPAQIILKRNQVIAREGDTITPQILSQLTAIRAYGQTTRQLNRFLGALFFVAAFYWIARKYVQHRSTVVKLILSSERIFALVGLAVLAQTILISIGFALANFTASENFQAPLNDAAIWAFCIPFASSALLVTLLVDEQIALIVAIFTALLAGLIAPRGVEFSIYAAISTSMSIYGIARYHTRQSVTTAGLLIGIVNAVTGIALIGYMREPFILNSVLLAIGCGMLGGIIAAAVTALLLPVFESLFGILTDIKLLELSNADLPVLGQLALRAPGTNQHSHAVGQIAQDGCRAIGANVLLVKVGSLYHDIGKLAAPDHFIENQRGSNPHDRLKPLQSAKIITSHVSYGIRLAREVGLPERIVDFIPQHHGTRTLHYFLKKAQANAEQNSNNEECKQVCEADFRYPGPKPQFKETAVLMIADSCEAAVRTLDAPTSENIRFIVNKIIDAILADDQLDECDLTLRELIQIRESMISSLAAIYHSRIDYPGFTLPKETTSNGNDNQNGNAEFEAAPDSEERGFRGRAPKEIPISIGGEVEDEAV
ncbi:MAG: HDIG domain-containing metalloprotein [Pyrinomonadaceae bacterium]